MLRAVGLASDFIKIDLKVSIIADLKFIFNLISFSTLSMLSKKTSLGMVKYMTNLQFWMILIFLMINHQSSWESQFCIDKTNDGDNLERKTPHVVKVPHELPAKKIFQESCENQKKISQGGSMMRET